MRAIPLVLAAGLVLAVPVAAQAATPGAVQAEQSPAMPGPDGNVTGKGFKGGSGGKLAGFFTPQQRAVFLLQARDQIRDMTPDQRKAYRKEQVGKILAMSQTDREKFKVDLQAKWDALPQAQKDRIQQRLAARETRAGQPIAAAAISR